MGSIQPLIEQLKNADPNSILALNCTWCLSNLIRGKPMPKEQDIINAIPIISKVLELSTVEETILEALQCFSYMSDGDQATILLIMETGIIPKMISWTMSIDRVQFWIPSLNIIGNFVTGQDEKTEYVIQCGFLEAAIPLLEN